jgi:hypothetical protein
VQVCSCIAHIFLQLHRRAYARNDYVYSYLLLNEQPQDMPGECACVHSYLSNSLPLTHAFLSNTRATPATFQGKVSCTRISPLAIVCFTLITRSKSPTLGGRESSRQVSCTHDHWVYWIVSNFTHAHAFIFACFGKGAHKLVRERVSPHTRTRKTIRALLRYLSCVANPVVTVL